LLHRGGALSRFEFNLNGLRRLLGSIVQDDNVVPTVDLTNPDIYFGKSLVWTCPGFVEG
jgi:hypothetical protein